MIDIDDRYITFQYCRSSGPGGQNVNKVNSKVELFFDIDNCPQLSSYQKQLIKARLKNRISHAGQLRIICQKFRSQLANKNAATEILLALLEKAVKTPAKRRKTQIPPSVKRRRLEKKTKRGQIKKLRSQKPTLD